MASFRFTPKMLDFLREGYRRLSLADLAAAFNREFGTDRSEVSIRAATRNHNMKSGRTGLFKPGHISWNTGMKGYQAGGRAVETQFKKGERHGAAQHNYKPIGSTRISKDGYIERKVTDDHPVPARRWIGEHRLVWEAANGPVPDGHVVVFLDGDKLNVNLENLRCVPRGVLATLNKLGMNETSGEARKAAILTAEVMNKASALERKAL